MQKHCLFYSFLFSTFIHFIFLRIGFNEELTEKEMQLNFSSLKIHFKNSQSSSYSKKTNKTKNQFKLSDLSLGDNNFSIDNTALIGSFGDETGLGASENQNIYHYIYKEISSHLIYPKILRDRKIEGHAKLRLVFDKKGLYKSSLSKLYSNSKFLKVLISRVLRILFRSPLPFDLSFVKHKYFIVDAIFRFQLKPLNNAQFDSQMGFIRGRTLYFHFHDQDSAINKDGANGSSGGLTYEQIVQFYKDHFTDAGKSRKIFQKKQFENFKNDKDW